jgi:VCBS repeat-containing protein
MADDNIPESGKQHDAPKEDAQQALDDLTVLQNVADQNLGEVRLNVARPVEVNSSDYSKLADIHAGSHSAPQAQVQEAGGVGVAQTLDIAIDHTGATSKIDAIDNIHLNASEGNEIHTQTTAKADDITFSGAGVETTEATGRGGEVEAAHAAPVGVAAPVIGAAQQAPSVQAAQAGPSTVVEHDKEIRLTHEGNHAPTLTGATDTSGDEHSVLRGRFGATDLDGDGVSFHLSGDNVVKNADGTETLTTDHGSVTLNTATGDYVFTPSTGGQLHAGETAADSFGVYATDSLGDRSSVGNVNLTITGSDDKATIKGDVSGVVGEDGGTATGALHVADADHDQSAAIAKTVTTDQGTFHVDAAGNWSFDVNTANADVQGLHAGETLTKTFTVTSADGGTTQDVTVTINGADDKATITGTTAGSVGEDGGKATGALHVADADHDQSAAIAQTVTTDQGTFKVDAAGNWSFDVNAANADVQGLHAGETLTKTFSVSSADGSTTQDVTVTITGADDKATITGTTSGSVGEDGGAATGALHVTDADHDQSAAIAQTVTTDQGTFKVDAAGNWSFDVNAANADVQGLHAGETLTKTFSVSSADGSTTQDVTVTITGADDKATITGTTSGSVGEDGGKATGTLTVSDADHDQSSAVAQTVTTDQGTFHVDAQGNWSFDVNAANADVQSLGVGETLTKTFSVASADGSTTQDVTVTITGSNDGPTVSAGPITTADDHSTATGTISGSDIDHGDSVTFHLSGTGVTSANGIESLTTDHGVVELNTATGSYTFTPSGEASLGVGQTASDSFSVFTTDSHSTSSASATVGVTITGSNDGPTVSAGPLVTSDDHSAINGSISGSDVDSGDSVTFHLSGTGVTSANGIESLTTDHGVVELNTATGSYTFTPSGEASLGVGQTASDSFSVFTTDSHSTSSASATVGVTITGSNDGPTVSAGPLVTSDDHSAINGSISGSDVDAGDSVTFHLSGTGVTSANGIETLTTDHGVVELNTATGSYTFTPSGEASLGVGQTASDSFSVFTTDAHSTSSASATVGVTITGSNDGPTVSAGPLVTSDDHSAINGSISGSDVDSGDSVTFHLSGTGVTSANGIESLTTDHGVVELNTATGSYTFTPSGEASLGVGQTASDSFSVFTTDSHSTSSASATVGVTITGSNDGPTVSAGPLVTSDDHSAINGSISGSDVDSGDSVTFHLSGTGVTSANGIESLTTDHGVVELNTATGSYTFTPSGEASLGVGQTASDSFSVFTTDAHSTSSASATVV